VLSVPSLTRIENALADVIPREQVALQGEWSAEHRRTYRSESQLGSGAPPFVDVVDRRWRGSLTAADAITGLAFLSTPHAVEWMKAPEASQHLGVSVLLRAYANFDAGQVYFHAGFATTFFHAVSVSTHSATTTDCLTAPSLTTGRMICVARADPVSFWLLLLPRDRVTFGRTRLWHLRDAFAADLPPDVRQLLTRRRVGTLAPP
jgi:hypothetical protein